MPDSNGIATRVAIPFFVERPFRNQRDHSASLSMRGFVQITLAQ